MLLHSTTLYRFVLPCAVLHCIVMCTVALLHYSVLSHLVPCSAVLCCSEACGCTVLYVAFNTLYITVSHNNVVICCFALNCVASCSVQGQTQRSFRIILMPRLLPGNSCPGTEMSGCPWALFSFFVSIFTFIFFFFSMSLTHSDCVECKCSFTL